MESDARILGDGDFVARLLAEAARGGKGTLPLSRKVVDLATLGRQIWRGVAAGEVGSGAIGAVWSGPEDFPVSWPSKAWGMPGRRWPDSWA